MTGERWPIAIGSDATEAVLDPPQGKATGPVFICAHGAGGNMDDSAVRAVSSTLTRRGLGVVRFNFLYRARGKGAPDPMPRLMSCFSAVARETETRLGKVPLIVGGRSMGGRTASMLVADGEPCAGLLLLAYPLHPPGQPAKLRVEHLPAITVPVLCMNGTRDSFSTPAIMDATIARLGSNWRMHWIEAADHSFNVPRKSGRTNQEVQDEVGDAVETWAATLR
jgi:predicted alpha/beta-hydrolase family hydrolase